MNSHWKSNAWLVVTLAAIGVGGVNCFAEPAMQGASEQTVRAGPIEAALKLDRSSLNTAESLIATLTVRAESGVRVSLPRVESKLGAFSVLSTVDEPQRTVATSKGDEQLFVRRYTLEPFLPGEYVLPPLEIRWQKSAGESGVARTAVVKIPVETLLKEAGKDGKPPDPGTIRGAYTPPVVRGDGSIWAGIVIGFVIASLGGAGIWVLRRQKQAADEIAILLERVQNLRRSAATDLPGTEALHELAGALRDGLARRVEPDAATADTGELVARLAKKKTWGDSEARRVGEVLGSLDAARFGGVAMPASEFDLHVEAVVGMLKKMRAMPEGVKR